LSIGPRLYFKTLNLMEIMRFISFTVPEIIFFPLLRIFSINYIITLLNYTDSTWSIILPPTFIHSCGFLPFKSNGTMPALFRSHGSIPDNFFRFSLCSSSDASPGPNFAFFRIYFSSRSGNCVILTLPSSLLECWCYFLWMLALFLLVPSGSLLLHLCQISLDYLGGIMLWEHFRSSLASLVAFGGDLLWWLSID